MRWVPWVVVAVVALTAWPPGPAAATPAGDRLARVAAYLREHQNQARVPGLAYAIVRGDRVMAQAAWGIDGDGRAITGQTPFVVGSVSKSFTAVAVMQLVETGRIDLDGPVRGYLPWFRLADESAAQRITVRQLLTHASGIPGVATRGLTDRYDQSPGALARSVRDLAAVEPTQPAGRSYQYSDANYMIAGAVVEAVTGEPFGAYLRTNVLDPLDMRRTAATAAEAEALGGVPAGHRYYFGRPRRFDPPFDNSGVPYGFLAASLNDLTHYAIAHLRGGQYGDRRILSTQGIQHMHTGQVPTGSRDAYGLGWREGTLDGVGARIVWHAGAVASSFSHILLMPQEDLAVVVLSNIYSIGMDRPLAAAAFNTGRILGGGQPVVAAEDPLFTWVLRGLLAIAGFLAAALVWSLIQVVRRRRHRPTRRRTLATTTGWVTGCAVVAAIAGWALPAFWDGAGLAQVLLFAPDIGHTIIAVTTLAAATAATRAAAAVLVLNATARPVTAAGGRTSRGLSAPPQGP
jgi:CubicO group peptidase (beta-lactamase class C family)